MTVLRRFVAAVFLFGAAGAWAAYWADRFFAARGRAEAAMAKLQPLAAGGLADPALAREVDEALTQSHRALTLAFGGPLVLALLAFAALWFFARRAP
jgi:hypothetical protein